MSAKETKDRTKPEWPWTARQKRRKASNRHTRKEVRHSTRNL